MEAHPIFQNDTEWVEHRFKCHGGQNPNPLPEAESIMPEIEPEPEPEPENNFLGKPKSRRR